MRSLRMASFAAVVITLCSLSEVSFVETPVVRIAQQFGLGYLPLIVMEDQQLVEKAVRKAGLPNVSVTWTKVGGTSSVNDALLSGNVDFSAGGVASLLTLWAKTKDTRNAVKEVAALNDMPSELLVNKSTLQSLKDFTPQDKIAVTSIKVSIQALLLQMATAQTFGLSNAEKLDGLTVSLPHPDAVIAMTSGAAGIVAHFSSPPFQQQERRNPNIKALFSSYDVMGGPSTFITVWSTKGFHERNPKTYAAFYEALSEAISFVRRDPDAAAATYKRMSRDKMAVEEISAILRDPKIEMTMSPHGVMKFAKFMFDIGRLKTMPTKWQDAYFPEVHELPGN